MVVILGDGTVVADDDPRARLRRARQQLPDSRLKYALAGGGARGCLQLRQCAGVGGRGGKVPAMNRAPKDHWLHIYYSPFLVRDLSRSSAHQDHSVLGRVKHLFRPGLGKDTKLDSKGREVDYGGADGSAFEEIDIEDPDSVVDSAQIKLWHPTHWLICAQVVGTRCASTKFALSVYFCGAATANGDELNTWNGWAGGLELSGRRSSRCACCRGRRRPSGLRLRALPRPEGAVGPGARARVDNRGPARRNLHVAPVLYSALHAPEVDEGSATPGRAVSHLRPTDGEARHVRRTLRSAAATGWTARANTLLCEELFWVDVIKKQGSISFSAANAIEDLALVADPLQVSDGQNAAAAGPRAARGRVARTGYEAWGPVPPISTCCNPLQARPNLPHRGLVPARASREGVVARLLPHSSALSWPLLAGFFAAGLRARGLGARRGTAAGIPGMPASSDGGSPASAAAAPAAASTIIALIFDHVLGVDLRVVEDAVHRSLRGAVVDRVRVVRHRVVQPARSPNGRRPPQARLAAAALAEQHAADEHFQGILRPRGRARVAVPHQRAVVGHAAVLVRVGRLVREVGAGAHGARDLRQSEIYVLVQDAVDRRRRRAVEEVALSTRIRVGQTDGVLGLVQDAGQDVGPPDAVLVLGTRGGPWPRAAPRRAPRGGHSHNA